MNTNFYHYLSFLPLNNLIQIMYSVLKSKKITHRNESQSSVTFCCFLNNENILMLFQDKQFSVINIVSQSPNKQVYRSKIQTEDIITDCKRISLNTCVVTTRDKESLIFLKFDNQNFVLVTQAKISELDFLNNYQTSSQIVPFTSNVFAIRELVFQDKMIHILIITFKEGFNITTKIISQELQWINSNFEIVKSLQKSRQFAIYKQRQIPEISWKIKFISICQEYDQKSIDLHDFLTEEHAIIDFLVKDVNQYYIFTKRCIQSNEQTIEVWRSRLHNNNGHYYQSCDLLTNYAFKSINFVEIIFVNYDLGFFLAKNFAHKEANGQIVDNELEIINLQTGITLQTFQCTLKSFDISPNKSHIVDYVQDINNRDEFTFHVRTLLSKKMLYYYLIKNSPIFSVEVLSRSFQAQILQLL